MKKTIRKTIVRVGSMLAAALLLLNLNGVTQDKLPYLDTSLSVEKRVNDLVGRMTLEEKISQMLNDAPAIERLGVPKYEWWNEGLHGVARAGIATVFPQAIGMAATWDTKLIRSEADVISTEARHEKNNEFVRNNVRERYKGLTFWSPNINIFRDPRWGRGQETYGEDPYLTGRLAVQFIQGLQGDDPKYLKVVATPKHFAVHSGPEPERHSFDAKISDRDLQETYLPAFRASIVEAKAESLMCAYNRTDEKPMCANDDLLQRVLRGDWKFNGYIVSDCGAITDVWKGHKFAENAEAASAVSVKAGTDLSCGDEYKSLVKAVKDGRIAEAEIDTAVKRLMTARFRLGMFDPPSMVKYAQIPFSENDSAAHHELSRKAAQESIVLLKNDGNTLPLKKDIKTIAVIGPNADAPDVLLGNYNGDPSVSFTPLAGIREKVSSTTQVLYSQGIFQAGTKQPTSAQDALRRDAIEKAKRSDAVVLVMGISPSIEGEEMDVKLAGFRGGDRTDIVLPAEQEQFIKDIKAVGKPVVLVLMGGSALAINWENENLPAILDAWYPGQFGGQAIADVLFGEYNPAGRLPVTFYKSIEQLPAFENYDMAGRTYRYFKGEPLYPFGYGLSYTQFEYSGLKAAKSSAAGRPVTVSATVKNIGSMAGDEVVEVYLKHLSASVPVPIRSLAGIDRIHLEPGETRAVSFTLTPRQMSVILDTGKRVVEPGDIEISIGGKQPGFTGSADARTTGVVGGTTKLTGRVVEIEK